MDTHVDPDVFDIGAFGMCGIRRDLVTSTAALGLRIRFPGLDGIEIRN